MNAYRALLAKDLRVELRTLESIPAMVLFAATTFVLFRFGLDRESLSGGLAAGVLLATVLFAAILAINRVFVAEREQGGFDLIRLAPVDGTSLYLAKASVLFVYLAAFELVAVPLFAILFLDDAGGLGAARRGPGARQPRPRRDRRPRLVDRGQLPRPRPDRSPAAAALAGPGDDRRRRSGRATARRGRAVVRGFRQVDGDTRALRCGVLPRRLRRLRLRPRGLTAPHR